MPQRQLLLSELALVIYMLRGTPQAERFLLQLPTMKVQDMDDGDMGSLLFVSSEKDRRLGDVLASTQYQDEDGVSVLASIHLDKEGDLYELDS